MTEFLLLVASDHCPGHTAVANPRVDMGERIPARHPAKELSIIDDEISKRELMGIEKEWGDAKSEDGDPEVDEVGHPQRKGHVKQQTERAHTEVNTRPSETRVQLAEWLANRGKPSSCGNVSGTAECEIAYDRMRVDLCGEDLEHRGPGQEMLSKTR
jgi:hypothetical protein